MGFTVGVYFAEAKDTFQSIYRQADIALVYGKRNGKKSICFYAPSMKLHGFDSEIVKESPISITDMGYICSELKEKEQPEGVYYLDYHTFMAFYCYFERMLARIGLKVHLILVSATDMRGEFIDLEERGNLIENLRNSICSSMRTSDIYTYYSSCQFLIMAPGAGIEDMDIIIKRIEQAFRQNDELSNVKLSFDFYPLQATEKGGRSDRITERSV